MKKFITKIFDLFLKCFETFLVLSLYLTCCLAAKQKANHLYEWKNLLTKDAS